MAPGKGVVVVVALVLFLAPLVSGGQAEQAAAPAPLLIRGTEVDESLATNGGGIVGYAYIGCLEMLFSRCFDDPTLTCVEDAMVECSLQAAAAAPAVAATAGPAAPLVGGGAGAAATELVLGAIVGIVGRGAMALGVNYISCVEGDLPKCFSDRTIGCLEKVMGEC